MVVLIEDVASNEVDHCAWCGSGSPPVPRMATACDELRHGIAYTQRRPGYTILWPGRGAGQLLRLGLPGGLVGRIDDHLKAPSIARCIVPHTDPGILPLSCLLVVTLGGIQGDFHRFWFEQQSMDV